MPSQLPLDSTADCGEPLPPDFGQADDGFKQTIIHGVVSWSTRSAVLISMSLLSDHCRCRCVNLRQPWEARAVASEGGREGRSWKTSSAQAIRRELRLCSNAGAHCCALHQRWPQSNQCRHRLSTGRSGVTSFGRGEALHGFVRRVVRHLYSPADARAERRHSGVLFFPLCLFPLQDRLLCMSLSVMQSVFLVCWGHGSA